MKPRSIAAAPAVVLTSSAYNDHQDRTKDVTKCGGVWLVNEPVVHCHTGTGDVVVGAHYGLVLDGIELAPAAETNVPLLNAFSGTGWWYLYARNDGSDGVEYFWDDQVPDDGFGVLLSDTNRRVAEVYVLDDTSGAEQIRPFRYSDGETIYNWTGYNGGAVLNDWRAAGPGAGGDASLADFIPPTSRTALLMLLADQNGVAPSLSFQAGVMPKGGIGTVAGAFPTMQVILIGTMVSTLDRRIAESWCETDASLDITYGATNCAASVYVHGYKR